MVTDINWSISDRPYKNEARKVVASSCKKNKASLLVMPGDKGIDIQLLLKHGVPSKNCHWHIIERNKEVHRRFVKLKLPLKNKNTTHYTQELSTITELPVMDFAWFDLCGNLTKADALWVKKLKIVPELDLFFTFTNNNRGNKFFADCKEALFLDFPDAMRKVVRSFDDAPLSVDSKLFPSIATQWQLLRYLFPKSNISCYVYRDESPMMLYHMHSFTDFRPLHFAGNIFDTLLGLKRYSADEVIDIVLSAKNESQLTKAKEALNSYIKQEGSQTRQEIIARITRIRTQQMEEMGF